MEKERYQVLIIVICMMGSSSKVEEKDSGSSFHIENKLKSSKEILSL